MTDFMLICSRIDLYAERHPTPSDVLLLVEVSDSTLIYQPTLTWS
jgi:hypothetical protein